VQRSHPFGGYTPKPPQSARIIRVIIMWRHKTMRGGACGWCARGAQCGKSCDSDSGDPTPSKVIKYVGLHRQTGHAKISTLMYGCVPDVFAYAAPRI